MCKRRLFFSVLFLVTMACAESSILLGQAAVDHGLFSPLYVYGNYLRDANCDSAPNDGDVMIIQGSNVIASWVSSPSHDEQPAPCSSAHNAVESSRGSGWRSVTSDRSAADAAPLRADADLNPGSTEYVTAEPRYLARSEWSTRDESRRYVLDTQGHVFAADFDGLKRVALFTANVVSDSNAWAGITYDGSDNSLWILDSKTAILQEYSVSGERMRSLALSLPSNGLVGAHGLAFDRADGTLWTLFDAYDHDHLLLTQYTKDGSLSNAIMYAVPPLPAIKNGGPNRFNVRRIEFERLLGHSPSSQSDTSGTSAPWADISAVKSQDFGHNDCPVNCPSGINMPTARPLSPTGLSPEVQKTTTADSSGTTITGPLTVTGTVQAQAYLFNADSVVVGSNGAGGSTVPGAGFYNTVVGDHAGRALTPSLGTPCLGSFWAGTDNTLIGTSGWSLTTGCLNTFVGVDAGGHLTSGYANTAVGVDAAQLGTSYNYVTAVGQRAAAYNTSNEIVAMGYAAGENNTSGQRNTIVGSYARRLLTTGNDDTVVGYQAMIGRPSTGDGGSNTIVGSNAGYYFFGGNTTAVGYAALYESGTSGTYGTANDTAIGYEALFSESWPGGGNTALGTYAGYSVGTGSYNTALGYNAGPASAGLTNTIAIGNNAKTVTSNTTVIGNSSMASTTIYGVPIVPKAVATPTSSSSACATGQFAFDSHYFYACVAQNTWVRAALASW